ncbi:MAG: rRNA maturation RNase YbeY [Myxococcota bacterium]|nr:rRNA maturation RNase YbeY [Myxococcota bacterium]
MPIRISGPPAGIRGARVDLPRLRRRGRQILSALRQGRSELSIALIDDAEMKALNRTWRGRDRSTDVLSFSMLEGEGGVHRGVLLGDVVISVETAAAQAAARHRSLDDEVLRLLLHGVLHVLGHDHEDEAEAREMERERRRVWKCLDA